MAKPSPPIPTPKPPRAALVTSPACTPFSSTRERCGHSSGTAPSVAPRVPIYFAALESQLRPPAGIAPTPWTEQRPPGRIDPIAESPPQTRGLVLRTHSAYRAAPPLRL